MKSVINRKPTMPPLKAFVLGLKLIFASIGCLISNLFFWVGRRLHNSYLKTTAFLSLGICLFVWAANPSKTTTVSFNRVSLIDTVVVSDPTMLDSIEILKLHLFKTLEAFEQTEAELLSMKKRLANTPSIVTAKDKKSSTTSNTESYFSYWMWYLKSREGFIPKAYICPAGYKTIGYGHNLDSHPKECTCKNYINSNGEISYSGATQLLVEDAERHLKLVKEQYPHLNRNESLAVTALAMNIGFAKVKKLGINKRILAGKDPQFHRFNGYYNTRKKWVVSPNLVRARKFDAAMYKGDLNEIRNLTEKYGYKNNVVKNQLLPAKRRGNL